MDLKNTLVNEVQAELEEIGKMALGSDEYVATVEGCNGLTDRLIKLEDVENEARKLELEKKKLHIEEKKIEHDKKNNWLRVGVSAGAAILYAAVQIWTVKDNQRYESGGGMHSAEGGRAGLKNLLNLMSKPKV